MDDDRELDKVVWRGEGAQAPQPKPTRPKPEDIYWPPDEGYPRLDFLYLEILWAMSRGIKTRHIIALTGCSRSYIHAVRARFRKKSPNNLLMVFRSIPWPQS